MENLPALSVYKSYFCEVAEGDTVDLEQMSVRLTNMGYRRQGQVELPGDFSIRGEF